jgi:hypothetical protein
VFQQTEQATALARSIHAEAMRNVERQRADKATQRLIPVPMHPDVARLLAAVRPMLRGWAKTGHKGNIDQWTTLQKIVKDLDR